MNTYKMKLLPKYFDELRRGSKYIEIRCNDEKRKTIKVEDRIVFINTETGEEADTTVLALEHYSSFEELICHHPVESFGFTNASVEDVIRAIYNIYTHEQEKQYGALGIILKTVLSGE